MKGVIITNPYDTNPVQARKALRMHDELTQLGVAVEVISNDKFVASITNGCISNRFEVDFALFFDKDKYSSMLLEKAGVRLFNSADATAICDDKMLTHIVLANHGIPMPDTLPGALCYNPNGVVTDDYLDRVVNTLGLPLVVKQCYGSFGEQVYLVNNIKELRQIAQSVKMTAHLFQRFEADSCGKDMRVIVIGGKIVCGMLRVSDCDFRSNVAHGGKATTVDVPRNIAEMCQQVASIIGLDYCGIDVLVGSTPKVCEVNSNAMFEAMESATGVNVARIYAQHIVDCVGNGR